MPIHRINAAFRDMFSGYLSNKVQEQGQIAELMSWYPPDTLRYQCLDVVYHVNVMKIEIVKSMMGAK